jgi:Reverse transcriptase (RNA-dependent DNA polymerase)
MNVPMGLSTGPNKKLLLRKTIYGLVQSARKFYEKLIEVLKVIGFEASKSDPCLWTMWDSVMNHMLIVGIYINDFLDKWKGNKRFSTSRLKRKWLSI